IDGLDHVGARLLAHDEKYRRLIVVPSLRVQILRSVDGVADVLDAHGGAVAIGDDHVVIVRRFGELVVGGDGEAAGGAVERALGGVVVSSGEHAGDTSQVKPLGGDLGRIVLHPTGGLLSPADRHLGHTGNLRDLLARMVSA